MPACKSAYCSNNIELCWDIKLIPPTVNKSTVNTTFVFYHPSVSQKTQNSKYQPSSLMY